MTKIINDFANSIGVKYATGEIGFGRPCVGLRKKEDYWLSYNPINMNTFDQIEGLHFPDIAECCPEDAYHKNNSFVVLGSGEDAIKQLEEWIISVKELGEVYIQEYDTCAVGLQRRICGGTDYALCIK
jgi:hypothetical protein